MVILYAGIGVAHLIKPTANLVMVPDCLPAPMLLILVSGLDEISLAAGLTWEKSRRLAAMLIMEMLLVYLLLIHLPQTLHFYQIKDPNFVSSLVRVGIQIILIIWAYWYVGPKVRHVSDLSMSDHKPSIS